MTQIRTMKADEAERVRDLWLQMCREAGTELPEKSAQIILNNLKQYTGHQMVHCFVSEEQQGIIGFVTCGVLAHPVMPGLSGEIEELYVQPGPGSGIHQREMKAALVQEAVIFLQTQGAGSIHTRICVGEEDCPEADLRAFWQSLGWQNDMTIYSIYSDVPGDAALQHTWDEYRAQDH
jgi:hypothetical protein